MCYPQRNRVYVIRMSCELPHAVGVKEEHGTVYYTPQRKQSKTTDHIRRSFERRVSDILVLTKLVLCLLYQCAPHTGQSSQLVPGANDRNVRRHSTIAGSPCYWQNSISP